MRKEVVTIILLLFMSTSVIATSHDIITVRVIAEEPIFVDQEALLTVLVAPEGRGLLSATAVFTTGGSTFRFVKLTDPAELLQSGTLFSPLDLNQGSFTTWTMSGTSSTPITLAANRNSVGKIKIKALQPGRLVLRLDEQASAFYLDRRTKYTLRFVLDEIQIAEDRCPTNRADRPIYLYPNENAGCQLADINADNGVNGVDIDEFIRLYNIRDTLTPATSPIHFDTASSVIHGGDIDLFIRNYNNR